MTVSYGLNEEMKSIIRLYSGSILRLAFAYLKNHSDAEDIAQDVFLAYLQKSRALRLKKKRRRGCSR